LQGFSKNYSFRFSEHEKVENNILCKNMKSNLENDDDKKNSYIMTKTSDFKNHQEN